MLKIEASNFSSITMIVIKDRDEMSLNKIIKNICTKIRYYYSCLNDCSNTVLSNVYFIVVGGSKDAFLYSV